MVKTNQNGDSLWTRSLFKGYSRSYGASVAIGPNGNIAVAGFEENKDTFGGYPTYSYLTPNGVILYHHIVYHDIGTVFNGFGGALFNSYIINNTSFTPFSLNLANPLVCEKIVSKPDGFTYVINLQGLKSIIVFKIDFNGNLIWIKQYLGKKGEVYISDATNNLNGGVLISGGTFDYNPADPYYYSWLLNTDANGNKLTESFIPLIENSWAAGAIATGNSIAVGLNLTTPSNTHANYFGFLLTDKDGKIR